MLPPINFKQWIEDHRHLLKPPVGNRVVYEDTDFIIMVVGGPNSRKDFHFNEGEEFFYQLEGDINLKVMENGQARDIPIREGEIFLLPPKVPHSPQRGANTVGLVVERKRKETEIDSCIWFCESCGNELYKENFSLKNIVTELPEIMNAYYSSEEKRTCNSCGDVMEPPVPVS
jgi:3-hydroxyanthranilate 3,4-dioxygenase